MLTEFLQEGVSLDFVPATDVLAGDVVVLGELVGIVQRDTKAGELGSISVDGVYAMPKSTGTGTSMLAGVILFWNATTKLVTTNAAAGVNKMLGKAIWPALDTDTKVRVRLSQ